MKCSPLQFRKMELFLTLNNYSPEFISPFILHPVLISPEQKRKPNPKQTNKENNTTIPNPPKKNPQQLINLHDREKVAWTRL